MDRKLSPPSHEFSLVVHHSTDKGLQGICPLVDIPSQIDDLTNDSRELGHHDDECDLAGHFCLRILLFDKRE
jgi:hypothetical protein